MSRLHDDDPYVGNTVAIYVIDGREVKVVGWRDISLSEYEWFDFYAGEQLLNPRSPLFRKAAPSFEEVETFLKVNNNAPQ